MFVGTVKGRPAPALLSVAGVRIWKLCLVFCSVEVAAWH